MKTATRLIITLTTASALSWFGAATAHAGTPSDPVPVSQGAPPEAAGPGEGIWP